MNTSSPHLEFELMTDLATGHVPPHEASTVRQHIDGCDACGLEFLRLTKLIGVMREDASEDAPARAITSVFRAYDDYRGARSKREDLPASIIKRIQAALRLDSGSLSPLYGMRSAGAGAERQLLFTAEDIDFDIRIAPADAGEWHLSGQVFDTISGGEIDLIKFDGEKWTAVLDENFCFSFPPVAEGVYRLVHRSATIEVEIPELSLGF